MTGDARLVRPEPGALPVRLARTPLRIIRADLGAHLLVSVIVYGLALAASVTALFLPEMVAPVTGLAVFAYRAFDICLTLAPTDATGWMILIPRVLTFLIEFQAHILLGLGAYLLGTPWLRPGTVGA